MEWTGTRRSCPQCGSRRTAGFIWGLPTSEDRAAGERGEVILGGCMVGSDDPHYGCGNCQTVFWNDRRFRTERNDEVIDGVAAWPAGRRPVRVELTSAGVLIAEPGRWAILIPEASRHGLFGVVWQEIWHTDFLGPVEWSKKRGIALDSREDSNVIEFAPHHYAKVQLLGLKDWVRSFGSNPFDGLLETLTNSKVGFLASVAGKPRENRGR